MIMELIKDPGNISDFSSASNRHSARRVITTVVATVIVLSIGIGRLRLPAHLQGKDRLFRGSQNRLSGLRGWERHWQCQTVTVLD